MCKPHVFNGGFELPPKKNCAISAYIIYIYVCVCTCDGFKYKNNARWNLVLTIWGFSTGA